MSRIQRRRFLLSTSAFLLAPFAAKAQQAGKVWRIGVLRPGPDDAVFRENIDPFRQALRDRGFAFQAVVIQKAQALLVLSSPAFNSARKEIMALALKHRFPNHSACEPTG